ncbi:hypothetical protein GCM10027054_08450 [Isoptericola nanjingensis]
MNERMSVSRVDMNSFFSPVAIICETKSCGITYDMADPSAGVEALVCRRVSSPQVVATSPWC